MQHKFSKFTLGQLVTKTKGSSWTGRVVGFYSTDLTPVGYCVESENEPGSVQIYPEAALTEKNMITASEAQNNIDNLILEYQDFCVQKGLPAISCDELILQLTIQKDEIQGKLTVLKDWFLRYENALHIRDNI